MDTKITYEEDITKYTDLKNNIINIISELSDSISYLNSIDNTLKTKYIVDDECTPVDNRVVSIINNISSTRDYLKNEILPEITSSVTETNNKIKKIDLEDKK